MSATTTNNFSASKDFDVTLKHIRREFEPEMKSAGDHMLSNPWPSFECLSKDAQFSLSQVLHLSHATKVQEEVIPYFLKEGNSVCVEAKTGSGKTLAFIIPLTERMRTQNDFYSQKHKVPFLSRNICAFIVSPSRVLAQQTFIVGRNYSCRYPYAVKYLLVDRHVENLDKTADRLAKIARGGGLIAVGTVADVAQLNQILLEREMDEDEEEEEDDEIDDDDDAQLATTTTKNNNNTYDKKKEENQYATPQFAPFPNHRFTIIIDEADVVLKDPQSYSKLISVCNSIQIMHPDTKFDFGLFGATATSAPEVNKFMEEFQEKFPSKNEDSSEQTGLKRFQLSSLASDAADLRNLYEMAEPHNILQSFVHILNMHHSKKHFVFFNNVAVLNFIHRLLNALSQGSRPVLRTATIFALHEGMKDSVRFEQFGKFVRYSGLVVAKKKEEAKEMKGHKNKDPSQIDYTNKNATEVSTGAILLCTDEAAFGLDVRDVDYVIHFEAPSNLQSFVHRCGRVARMGMTGTSILLLPENDASKKFLADVSEKVLTNKNKNDDEENDHQPVPEEKLLMMQRLHISGARAPITANIAAFVEEIATDALELERSNLAATTSAIHLPSRRSRLVEEDIEQQAQKAQHSFKASLVTSLLSSDKDNFSTNSNTIGTTNGAVSETANYGKKLVAQAIQALASSPLYSLEEATNALSARCVA
jgi:superfamily II DNA/RNA helicase